PLSATQQIVLRATSSFLGRLSVPLSNVNQEILQNVNKNCLINHCVLRAVPLIASKTQSTKLISARPTSCTEPPLTRSDNSPAIQPSSSATNTLTYTRISTASSPSPARTGNSFSMHSLPNATPRSLRSPLPSISLYYQMKSNSNLNSKHRTMQP